MKAKKGKKRSKTNESKKRGKKAHRVCYTYTHILRILNLASQVLDTEPPTTLVANINVSGGTRIYKRAGTNNTYQ